MNRPVCLLAWAAALLGVAAPVALALAVAACAPDLPVGGARGRGSSAELDAGVRVALEPPAPLDAATPVLRVRIQPAPGGAALDPTRVVLIEGTIARAQERQLERDEPSNALSERMVAALTWLEGDEVVLAPAVPLAAGEVYTVASGAPSFKIELGVGAGEGVLARVWPPADAGASAELGVWCGDAGLPAVEVEASLDPGGPTGRLITGAIGDGAGTRCVRFAAEDEARDGGDPESAEGGGRGSAPPTGGGGSPALLLDPRPLVADVDPPLPAPALACEAGELPFGPGCARVLDDRILGRSPEAPLLWSVRGEALDQVFVSGAGDPFVIAPLPPASALTLAIATLDVAGRAASASLSATTSEPMAHLVLNEVTANPLGPEPHQEWIEIVNDGQVEAALAGYVLLDLGGETPLPEAVLPAGGYALLVNESFVEDDGIDPVPAPGTLLLRVPELGNDGLTNAGEPLKLRGPGGDIVSSLPTVPKPKAGQSLARVAPGSPDGLAASFFVAASPSPGSAN